MPSMLQVVGVAAGLVTIASAMPAQPKLNYRAVRLHDISSRQAAAAPLTDIDILQL